LERRIRDDALTGMTSNPAIFEKALAEGTAYDAQLATAGADLTPHALFELIATHDVRTACDRFRRVYDATSGRDGFVSIEVSPAAARDVEATITEARRLWQAVGRPNVMIKVPGTAEGALAARRLLGDGINVNITLLFSIDAYRDIIEAYLGALEDRLAIGQPIRLLASVASFFVSRVDAEADKRLDALIAQGRGDPGRLAALKGKIAIANAKLAYAQFRECFTGQRWRRLVNEGARVQRPLWASTSTKNPAYSDVLYVDELIGPDTVNTMPPQTIEAFRDHGTVKRTVDVDGDSARRTIAALAETGISLTDITDRLLRDGIAIFTKSYDALLAGLERKTATLAHVP
jgi:transaldolase